MILYTDEIKKAVDNLHGPKGFIVDIMIYDEFDPPCIGLRFYSSQWDVLNEEDRYAAAIYLKKMKETIESFDRLVTLDPVNGAPA